MEESPKPAGKAVIARPSLWERLTHYLLREPEDRDDLVEILHAAFERHLLDAEALAMIEGVLQVGDLQVRDIMIPRSQIDMIHLQEAPEAFVPFVIETAHSRFPVFDQNRDDIVGILLAKDLLRYFAGHEFNLRDMLRPAVFVPESKRLNILLKEFRHNRNHMAIVVDEYGGVSGLVTIEDVIEQIVGDIEDEHDYDEPEDNILEDRMGRWRVKATTDVTDFNAVTGASLTGGDLHTIGGLVLAAFGRLPKRGEMVELGGYVFHVLRADSRRIHSLMVERQAEASENAP